MEEDFFPEITTYFKKFQEAQQKLQEIQNNKKLLEEIADLGKIEQIQTAVEQRMGPKMCDNTELQSNSQKNAFLDVLQDFKREMETSNKAQQTAYQDMKKQLSIQQKNIQQRFEASKEEWTTQRKQFKGYYQSVLAQRYQKSLIDQSDSYIQHHQKKLIQLQHFFEIELLQLGLTRKQCIDELLLTAKL